MPKRAQREHWAGAALEAVVQASVAHDEAAFEELFARYESLAWAVARASTSTFAAAQDAVVDGFAAAFQTIDRLQAPSRFPGYLARCVRNEALMSVRRLWRITPTDTFEEVPGPDGDPSDAVIDAYDSEQAQEAFDRLSHRQQEAVLLVDVDGKAPAEAATELGITINALYQLLYRARQNLKTQPPS